MDRRTLATAGCFFGGTLLIFGASLSSHWRSAGNHGLQRCFGPRATTCTQGECRSFRYGAEVDRAEQVLKSLPRHAAESEIDYKYRTAEAISAVVLARRYNARGWRLMITLAVAGLIFALLGLLVLRRPASADEALRLPTILRITGCCTAVVLGVLSWIFTQGLAVGVASEDRFMSMDWAFVIGQAGMLLGGVGGALAGSKPSMELLFEEDDEGDDGG